MIKKKGRRARDNADDDNGFALWGGYMAAKQAKLEGQFLVHAGKEKEQKSDIFKGIAIYVNGYTVPTADELKRIMIVHGGVYHHYESHSTTHIIASNLPNVKIKQLKTLNVVKPSWIADSVAEGRLLDYRKYLLYSNQTKSQPRLNFPQPGTSSRTLSKDSEYSTTEKKSQSNTLSNIVESEKGDENVKNVTEEKCPVVGDIRGRDFGKEKDTETTSAENQKYVGIKQPAETAVTSPSKVQNPGASRRTAVEPEFLSEFYGNSRLHHLSTMGAMFKEYVARLREGSQGDFPGVKRLTDWKKKNGINEDVGGDEDLVDDLVDEMFANGGSKKDSGTPRTIMHIDMDCFFVSVGLRKRPDLRDCPVAVTHARGNSSHAREGANRQFERDFYKQRFQNRMKQKQGAGSVEEEVERKSRLDDVSENDSLSEIASCNYEARKAGIKNGMFFGMAIKLCPDLKTIPYDFEGYKEVSYKLYDTLASYTLDIEAVSCDEMYVDCTKVLKKANVSALEFASFLRAEIKNATGCTASAGFGSNPLQARLATKKAKPNGQFHLLPAEVEMFMHSIKVEDLPGVGHSLAYRLHSEGVETCRDLQWHSLASLQKKFGNKTGEALHQHSKGQDHRALDVCHQRKSVSAEVNYGIRFTTQREAETFLQQLADEVVARMKQARVRGRQVTLKLMVRAKDAPVETAKFMGHGACDNISRSTSLGAPTDDANIIYREAVALERQLKVPPSDLRGVGIQMSRLMNLGASGSVKATLLTNFLGLNKAKGVNVKEKEESNSMQKESTKEQSSSKSKGFESVSPFADCGTVQIAGKTSTSGNKNIADKKESVVLECKIQEKKLDKLANEPKCNHVNERKGTTTSCEQVAQNAVCVEPKSDPLPMLTPPIEVPMMTLAQARKLVRAWVLSEVNPQSCDVVMFASYIQRLVLARRLEDVDILYSLLHRLLINKGRTWKAAYGNIVKDTQTIMQAVYGADLNVPEFD